MAKKMNKGKRKFIMDIFLNGLLDTDQVFQLLANGGNTMHDYRHRRAANAARQGMSHATVRNDTYMRTQ